MNRERISNLLDSRFVNPQNYHIAKKQTKQYEI